MGEKEHRSLVQQLMFCYAANRRAAAPCRLAFAGLEGPPAAMLAAAPGADKWEVEKSAGSYLEMFKDRKGDLVYLSADAEEELEELDASKVRARRRRPPESGTSPLACLGGLSVLIAAAVAAISLHLCSLFLPALSPALPPPPP